MPTTTVTLSVSELRRLDDAMIAAHLRDRLTVCGCSKTTLRVCVSCAEVTCTCQRARGGCRCSPEKES